MGSKNLDRWSREDWRAHTRTVGEMAARGWHVFSRCESCHLAMVVDLKLVAYVSGPQVVLWNRRAPCRRMGCTGIVRFHGKPPQIPEHMLLEAEWPHQLAGPRHPPGQR